MQKIRYGNPDTWRKVMKRYQENNNPHSPSLAVLASEQMTDELVKLVHDRMEEGDEVEGVVR